MDSAVKQAKGRTGLGELDPNQLPLDLFEFDEALREVRLRDYWVFGPSVTKDPTGASYPDLVTVTYNSTTTRITLTGDVEFYWHGRRILVLVDGWVSPALTAFYPTPNTTYYLYYDGTSFIWSATPWSFDMLQIANVNYTAAGVYRFGLRETHGLMPWQTHRELHKQLGTRRDSGGTLSAIVIDSTTAADRRPAVAATVIMDEDLPTTNAALAAGSYTRAYLSGAGATNEFALTQSDIVALSGAQPYYNQYTGGAWQQTLLPNNSYMCVWLIAIPVTADTGAQAYRYLWLQGQSQGTLSEQQAQTPASLNLGALTSFAPEFVFVARLILHYTAANWRISQADMITSGRYVQVTPPENLNVAVINAGTGNFTDLNVTNPIAGSITGNAATADEADNADTVDNAHASVTPGAGEIPILNGSGKGAFSITGDADTLDGAHASTTASAGVIPILDGSAKGAFSITGDAATFGGKTPANFVLDLIYPVGCYYTQYPDASSNTDATEFPEAQRPATLFGGTWAEQWSTESVYFRTRGTLSDTDRVSGSQADALQEHTHTSRHGGGTGGSETAYVSKTNAGAPGPSTNATNNFGVTTYGSVAAKKTANETRVVNRRIKVWKRTA